MSQQEQTVSASVDSNKDFLSKDILKHKLKYGQGYTSTRVVLILIFLCFVTGFSYILWHWPKPKNYNYILFVSMLISATIILLVAFNKIYEYFIIKGYDFYLFVIVFVLLPSRGELE